MSSPGRGLARGVLQRTGVALKTMMNGTMARVKVGVRINSIRKKQHMMQKCLRAVGIESNYRRRSRGKGGRVSAVLSWHHLTPCLYIAHKYPVTPP